MNSSKTSTAERRTTLCIIGLLVLSIGYPLSLGPATWLDKSGFVSRPVMDTILTIYYPIDLLYLNSIHFQKLIDWYLDFWV